MLLTLFLFFFLKRDGDIFGASHFVLCVRFNAIRSREEEETSAKINLQSSRKLLWLYSTNACVCVLGLL